MKKNTKKKVFTLMLVILLLSIAIVGGSLAWFTAEDDVTNVFTVGTIGIQQHEKGEQGGTFQQNQTLYPVISEENVENDPNFIHKRVSIENTGSNSAYIRTWIAVPKELDSYLNLKTNGNGWVEQWAWPTVTVNNAEYIAHCYVYDQSLNAGVTSPELLTGVYLLPSVDIKNNPATPSDNLEFCKYENGSYHFSGFEIASSDGKILENKTVNVLVATQAVQVQGFDNAQHALNTAFGEPINSSSVPSFTSQNNS